MRILISSLLLILPLLSFGGGDTRPVIVPKEAPRTQPKEAYVTQYNRPKPIIKCKGTLALTCDVYLGRDIGTPDLYLDLRHALMTAKSSTTFVFHMQGNGGYISGMIAILQAIAATKAKVVTIIEGPVYSAHGLIALAGHEVIGTDYGYVMLHHSSAYGKLTTRCLKYKGKTDRGQDMEKKCRKQLSNHLLLVGNLIRKIAGKYLTGSELYSVLTGHDVYIPPQEMKKRLRALKLK
jgi:ATP-dependent protease ClpP protease subunit